MFRRCATRHLRRLPAMFRYAARNHPASLTSAVASSGDPSMVHQRRWSTSTGSPTGTVAHAAISTAPRSQALRVNLDSVAATAALSSWVRTCPVSELPVEWICFLHMVNGSGGGMKEGSAQLLEAVADLFAVLQHRTDRGLRRLEFHVTSSSDASVDRQAVARVAVELCGLMAAHAASLSAVCIPFFPDDMMDHRLIQRMAASMGACTRLCELNVSGCRRLVAQPAFFRDALPSMGAIRALGIAHTDLDAATMGWLGEALLASIGGWGMLRALDMSHQRNVPEAGWTRFLQQMLRPRDADDAGASLVPRLEDIRFDNCKLNDAMMFQVAGCVAECTALRRLDLSRNQFTTTGAAHLAVGLHGCSDLEVLRLARNRKCTDSGAMAITTALSKLVHLKELDLSFCGITVHSIGEVSDACHALEALQTLRLEGNQIGLAATGARWEDIAMQRAMEQSGPQDLALNGSASASASTAVDPRVAADFEIRHRDQKTGRRRYTGGSGRDAAGCPPAGNNSRDASLCHPLLRLNGTIALLPALEVVSLADTGLSGREVVQVLGALVVEGASPTVRELDLSFTGTTGNALCILLGRPSSLPSKLETLLLAGCRELGDVGIAQLCERPDDGVDSSSPLARCQRLQQIDLSGCGIDRDGWEALLCDGLGCTPTGEGGAFADYTVSERPVLGLQNVAQLMLSGNRPMTSGQLSALLRSIEQWMPLCRAVALHGSASDPRGYPDDARANAAASALQRLSRRGCVVAL